MGLRADTWLLATSAVGLAIGLLLGVGYAARNASHAGFYRVHVADAGPDLEGFVRPRRTVVVVVDGLGHVEARGLRSLARLASVGQCRTTSVGPLSVSRPVYAVISTGLDQDRTGARGNDDDEPLAAESIWALARRHGLRVTAISELPWWRELFPSGFDAYRIAARGADFVRLAPPGDLVLVHPVYVDEVGHAHGAASVAYDEAVRRVDREIGEQLDALDLGRDLLVVTADHGHTLAGGHGGRQARVAWVRTCWAGRGVAHAGAAAPMRSTTIAPALSVLLGLPFPADMRAGEDELDTIFAITDPAAFPDGYLDERRATIARFREENARALRAWWPGSEGRWSLFRQHHRARQAMGLVPCVLIAAVVLALEARAHRRAGRSPWPGVILAFALPAALVVTQLFVRGSFDLGSVGTSEGFILFTVGMAMAWSLLMARFLWNARRRAWEALALDWAGLSAIGALVAITHPLVFGWSAGYPAPPAELFFYPYFVTLTFSCVHGTGLAIALLARQARRLMASESEASRSPSPSR